MTKKLIPLILFTFVLYTCFILGCENKSINRVQQKNSPTNNFVKSKSNYIEKNDAKQNNTSPDNKNKNKTDFQNQSFIRKSSGIVNSVPWENDISFKKAQEKSDAYVMLAAYCTVLPDPSPGEEDNVHIGAKLLLGTIVEPGKVFSQNKTIGPYTKARGYNEGPTYVGSRITTTIGGGVCKIATTLYNTAIMSNFQIVERHAHSMPVSYAPYGQDATVSYGINDFRFKNNTNSPVLIWTNTIDNILYIGFYGKSKPPKVQWHHQVSELKKTKKIYKLNPKLAPGTEKLVVIGGDGAKVKSWVTIEQADGTVITKLLGWSSYLPLPYIYEKGR